MKYLVIGLIEFKFENSHQEAAKPIIEYAIIKKESLLKYKISKLNEVCSNKMMQQDDIRAYATYIECDSLQEAIKCAETNELSINNTTDQ